MPRDQICVCTAPTLEEAYVVVAWLASQGVDAYVNDRHLFGTYAWIMSAFAPRGVEVVVFDQSLAVRAVDLLQEHQAALSADRADAPPTPVEATCENCDATATFPAPSRGRVENCPKCGAYMDVPE